MSCLTVQWAIQLLLNQCSVTKSNLLLGKNRATDLLNLAQGFSTSASPGRVDFQLPSYEILGVEVHTSERGRGREAPGQNILINIYGTVEKSDPKLQ